MSNHDDGGVIFFSSFNKKFHNLSGVGGIEGAGRFVGKKNFWFNDHGASNGYALILSTRQFTWNLVGATFDSNFFEPSLSFKIGLFFINTIN